MSEHDFNAPGLGFGCASLYGLPAKSDRRALLEHAYALGIRHFDVAPMYGLGLAESELAEFAAGKSDVKVATKFGIRPTAAGRLAGLVQPPIRRILQASPALKTKVRSSGVKRDSGIVGRILYSDHDYSVENARRSLLESLRTLRTPRIEYFLLHEPGGGLAGDVRPLIDYLRGEQDRGVIGRWGPAGDLTDLDGGLTAVSEAATVRQYPYDLIDGYGGPEPDTGCYTITFGFISTGLSRARDRLDGDSGLRNRCSELLGADLGEDRNLVRLLVRDAVTHNAAGTVLVSSTKMRNLEMLCEAAATPLPHEADVATMIRQELD